MFERVGKFDSFKWGVVVVEIEVDGLEKRVRES